jgi:hypothetical protein
MKKLLLVLLALPLLFSCGGSLEQDLNKEITDAMLDDGYTGKGTYTLADGSKYVGEFKDGMQHGQGTYTWGKGEWEGDKYVGAFKDDMMHGQGTYTTPDGDKYVGEFKDDMYNGQGTNTFANGNKYVGEYKDDMYNGQGTATWANGDKYVGEWMAGMMHGQGTGTLADGTIKKGLWQNNQFLDNEVSAKNEEDTEDQLIIGEIDDPDGYTNVRKKPSSNSEIIYKIYKGESFFLSDTSGLWWTVISNNDIGFIHRSRVRIISN